LLGLSIDIKGLLNYYTIQPRRNKRYNYPVKVDSESMKSVEILRKVVNDSSCSWSNRKTCAQCPLSRLKQKEDGSYMSCIEAVGAQELIGPAADDRYQEVATKLLIDYEIEAILEQE
jgi:hypothetical protein